jgi:hypothetical protein
VSSQKRPDGLWGPPTQLPIQRVPVGVLPVEADHLHVDARFGTSGVHRSNVPHTLHGSFDVAVTVSGCTARSVLVTASN